MDADDEARLCGEPVDRQRLSRQLLRISCQRNRASRIRSQIAFERKNLCYARDFEYESIQQFMGVLQDADASQTLNTRNVELRHLHHQCERDRAAFEAKNPRVTTLQTDLAVVEFQLMQTEQRVALPSEDAFRMSGTAPTDYTSEDSHKSSTDTPSVLEAILRSERRSLSSA